MWMLLLACSSAPGTSSRSRPVERVDPPALVEAHEALKAGEAERAIELFDALLAEGDDPAIAIQRAHALRMNGDIAGSRAGYEAVLARHPDEPVANLALGELLRSEERWSEAIPRLEHAAALTPGSPLPHEHLAVCLWELGRVEEARAALDRAEALGSSQVGVLGRVIR